MNKKKTLIKLYKDQKSIIALNVSSKTGILDVKVRIYIKIHNYKY